MASSAPNSGVPFPQPPAAPAPPPPPDEPPPDYNPEALEDIERGTFKNVDLETTSKQQQPFAASLPPQQQQQPPSATAQAGWSYKATSAYLPNQSQGTATGQQVPSPEQGQVTESSVAEATAAKSAVSHFTQMSFKDQVTLLAVFSLVVMTQSSINCAENEYPCTETYAFAVASGTISLILCGTFVLLEHWNRIGDNMQRFTMALFMFLWWVSSMIVLTFFSPFTSVAYANGYFGTWGAFIIATIMLSTTSEFFRKTVTKIDSEIPRKPLMYLLIASIVEIGAAIPTCIPNSQCNGLNAFAMALGTVSVILCLVMIPLIERVQPIVVRRVAIFFCLWWVIGGLIVTFIRPFKALGNGYFSVFAAVISSFYLLQ